MPCINLRMNIKVLHIVLVPRHTLGDGNKRKVVLEQQASILGHVLIRRLCTYTITSTKIVYTTLYMFRYLPG